MIGQNAAFRAAMNGAPLAESLGILAASAVEQADGEMRCAFYIAADDDSGLHHVTGMGEDYARHVDGGAIAPDSIACGLAVDTDQPVITPDVREEPRWRPWLWLAEAFGYRGCWSFPIETSHGKLVGTFAMYFAAPCDATADRLAQADRAVRAASIIIDQHQGRARLEAELADTRVLQMISTELIHEENVELLYGKILQAARTIMRSDFASLQVLHQDRGRTGELELLASIGFNAEAERVWAWVDIDSDTACGEALRTGQRAILRDVEAAIDPVSPDFGAYLSNGIRAVQTTPLISRGGAMLGIRPARHPLPPGGGPDRARPRRGGAAQERAHRAAAACRAAAPRAQHSGDDPLDDRPLAPRLGQHRRLRRSPPGAHRGGRTHPGAPDACTRSGRRSRGNAA